MKNLLKKINWKRIICSFMNHSYPYLDCSRCGRVTPWELMRDHHGNIVTEEDGSPMYQLKDLK